MKLAAMQPYFFPYLGQFALLMQADIWVVHDQAQYIRHGWVNRNRVLHPASSWQYITVPLKKHPYTASINQVEVNGSQWRADVFKKLLHYHMDAPFYKSTVAFLEEALGAEEGNLAALNTALFRKTADWLGIKTPILLLSETHPKETLPKGAEPLALFICDAFAATEYINPPGGAGLYSPDMFLQRSIKLSIQSYRPFEYTCGRFEFIPNLSIIDVMMWNSPDQVMRHLNIMNPASADQVVGNADS